MFIVTEYAALKEKKVCCSTTSTALAAILFNGAEPFGQFLWSALQGSHTPFWEWGRSPWNWEN